MTDGQRLRELLDAATADVPPDHRGAPLAAIHRRVRRRRVAVIAGVAAALTVLVLGGVAVAAGVRPTPSRPAPAASPSPSALPVVPWWSAMVARDDRTITVYAGVKGCTDVTGPRGELVRQSADRVVIAVRGAVVPAGDCATGGQAVPVTVHLSAPLGDRTVLGASGGSRPVYHERDLPDLAATGWTRAKSAWAAGDDLWSATYSGPNGSAMSLTATPTRGRGNPGTVVTTMRLGSHDATITRSGGGLWNAIWRVGGNTYVLTYVPSEGGSTTQDAFTHLLRTLRWG